MRKPYAWRKTVTIQTRFLKKLEQLRVDFSLAEEQSTQTDNLPEYSLDGLVRPTFHGALSMNSTLQTCISQCEYVCLWKIPNNEGTKSWIWHFVHLALPLSEMAFKILEHRFWESLTGWKSSWSFLWPSLYEISKPTFVVQFICLSSLVIASAGTFATNGSDDDSTAVTSPTLTWKTKCFPEFIKKSDRDFGWFKDFMFKLHFKRKWGNTALNFTICLFEVGNQWLSRK